MRRHGQLGAYQLAVEGGAFAEHGERSGGAALLQLGRAAAAKSTTLQLQAPLDTDDEPTWARDLVEEVAEGMAGAVFAATPGSQCGTCQVKDSCPAYAEGRRL